VLKAAGIPCAGAGRNLAESRAPAVIGLRGKGRVLVLGFATGSSGIDWQWGAYEGRPGVNLLEDRSAQTVRSIGAEVARFKGPTETGRRGGRGGFRENVQ
jgi:poly-gamma-glutamate synthesis protein (capsule biosynthesis protein)